MMVTFIKGETPFPEFSAVATLDDIQFAYYDINDNTLLHRAADNFKSPPDNSDINLIGQFAGFAYGRIRDKAAYLRDFTNHTKSKSVLQSVDIDV